MKTSALGLYLLVFGTTAAIGQATPTASRRFDLQAGGGFTFAKADYGSAWFKGGALYTTLDFTPHFGAEFDFHQADSPSDATYERTYEWGGRYHREYGRFEPYAKGMYGRGVFNYVCHSSGPIPVTTGGATSAVCATLAYNEYVLGAGVDYHLLRFLNLRGDYEYEYWRTFQPHGLTPQLVTIGVAYHFPGGLGKGRRFK